jgi:hypothetical protein
MREIIEKSLFRAIFLSFSDIFDILLPMRFLLLIAISLALLSSCTTREDEKGVLTAT